MGLFTETSDLLKKNSGSTGGKDRPKANLWVNVGFIAPTKNKETGEAEELLVSLPVGIPVDVQSRIKLTNNAEYNKLISGRNALLDQLIEAGEQLKPGESRQINLIVHLRRINEEPVADTSGDNPFMPHNVF